MTIASILIQSKIYKNSLMCSNTVKSSLYLLTIFSLQSQFYYRNHILHHHCHNYHHHQLHDRSQFEKSQAIFLNRPPVSFKETSHTYFFLEMLLHLRTSATIQNMFSPAFCFNLSTDIRHSHRFCDVLVLLNKRHLCLCLQQCQSELKTCQLC